MNEVLTIDLSPIEEFKYNQISNHKFEFVLLNPELKAIHSAFECKDYLQDIFYCEHNNRTSSIYGLKWKPGMFDVHQPRFFLALNGGTEKIGLRTEQLQKFLNTFEEVLGIEPTQVFPTESEKIIVLNFSIDWTINGPMLSAYTTLIRAAGSYEEGDVLEYLQDLVAEKIKAPAYVGIERARLAEGNLEKIAALLQGKRPEYSWSDLNSIQQAHDTGITNFSSFPRVKLPKRS